MSRFKILCNFAWCSLLLLGAAGCVRSTGPEVVVYCALDKEFSEPILEQFTADTGVLALTKFDVESTKTVGLAEAMLAERQRPRCDVFWNNEILHTLRLEKHGLLTAYRPPMAAEYPKMYRSADGAWHGFAARARVLLVNTSLVNEADRPSSIRDLVDPKWKDRVAIAKPLFGTTATHAACLFAAWGDLEAQSFFRQLKANAQIKSGNRQVAADVAAGAIAFGLTDTDDCLVEIVAGAPVVIVYPDQQPDEIGTLFIPNTLAILKNCPHPVEACRLVDFLLTPKIEEQLAAGPSGQIPLHPAAKGSPRVRSPAEARAMTVDFSAAAELWPRVAKFLRDEFAVGR